MISFVAAFTTSDMVIKSTFHIYFKTVCCSPPTYHFFKAIRITSNSLETFKHLEAKNLKKSGLNYLTGARVKILRKEGGF